MSLPEPSKPTIVGHEKCNIAKVQNKNYKIMIMNMFKELREDLYKYKNEIHENTNS